MEGKGIKGLFIGRAGGDTWRLQFYVEGRDGVVGWGVQGREALYGMCGGQDFIMNRFWVMV